MGVDADYISCPVHGPWRVAVVGGRWKCAACAGLGTPGSSGAVYRPLCGLTWGGGGHVHDRHVHECFGDAEPTHNPHYCRCGAEYDDGTEQRMLFTDPDQLVILYGDPDGDE